MADALADGGLGAETCRVDTRSQASAKLRLAPCLAITDDATLAPDRPMLTGSMLVSQP